MAIGSEADAGWLASQINEHVSGKAPPKIIALSASVFIVEKSMLWAKFACRCLSIRTTQFHHDPYKQITFSQVREQIWPVLRENGYVIEEPDSDAEDYELFDEKTSYLQNEEVAEKFMSIASEKALYHNPEPGPIVEVHIDRKEIESGTDVRAGGQEGDGVILDGRPDDRTHGAGEPEADAGFGGGDIAAEQDTKEKDLLKTGDDFVYNIGTKDDFNEEEREDEDEGEAFIYGDEKNAAGQEQEWRK